MQNLVPLGLVLVFQLLIGAVFLRAAFALFFRIEGLIWKPISPPSSSGTAGGVHSQSDSQQFPIIQVVPKKSKTRNREPDLMEAGFILFVTAVVNTATYFGFIVITGHSKTAIGAIASIIVSLFALAGMIRYTCRVTFVKALMIAGLYVLVTLVCVGGIVILVALASGMLL